MSHKWLCGTETQPYENVKLVLICKEGNLPSASIELPNSLKVYDSGSVIAGVWLSVCMCLIVCMCVRQCICVWLYLCVHVALHTIHLPGTTGFPWHMERINTFWTWKTVYLCAYVYGCVCVTVGDDCLSVTVWGCGCGGGCVRVCVWLYVWLCIDVAVGGIVYVYDCVWLCASLLTTWLCLCECVYLQRTPWLSIWMGSRNPFFLLVIPQQPSVHWLLQL